MRWPTGRPPRLGVPLQPDAPRHGRGQPLVATNLDLRSIPRLSLSRLCESSEPLSRSSHHLFMLKQLVNSAPFVTSTGPFLTSALADYGADNFTDKPKLRSRGSKGSTKKGPSRKLVTCPMLLLACTEPTAHRNSCARSPRIKLLCDGRRDALLDWAYHFLTRPRSPARPWPASALVATNLDLRLARWGKQRVNSAPVVTSTGPVLTSTALADFDDAWFFPPHGTVFIKNKQTGSKELKVSSTVPCCCWRAHPTVVRAIATNKARIKLLCDGRRPPRLGVPRYHFNQTLSPARPWPASRCNQSRSTPHIPSFPFSAVRHHDPHCSKAAHRRRGAREGRRRGHGDRRVAQLRRPAQPARGHGAPRRAHPRGRRALHRARRVRPRAALHSHAAQPAHTSGAAQMTPPEGAYPPERDGGRRRARGPRPDAPGWRMRGMRRCAHGATAHWRDARRVVCVKAS
eukprot:scaffold27242_cov70-Phaeocystis_antarctica.AAC.3